MNGFVKQEEARDAEKARKAAQGESDSESFDEDEPDSKQQQRVKKMKSEFTCDVM